MLLTTYHIFNKKSIVLAILALFLFILPAEARIPTDNGYIKQKSYYQQINLPQAWDITTGAENVVVAIIDIGFDINNDDIKDNIWINKDEIPDNRIDDDNNGYVDDYNGWNFVDLNNSVKVPDLSENDELLTISHGTVLAGIIGAKANNESGGVGMNWNIKLMLLRAMNNEGFGSFITVSKAIDYAVENGADIINISMIGTEDNEVFNESVKNAYNHGVLVLSASGNDAREGKGDLDEYQAYPICSADQDVREAVFGVTSVNSEDIISDFANYGSCVDISSPGERIASSVVVDYGAGFKNAFASNINGTSFATGFVTGAAAMIKSLAPDWGAEKIMSALRSGTDDINYLNPNHSNLMGAGRLNVYKSLQKTMESDSFLLNTISKVIYYKDNGFYLHDLVTQEKKLLEYFINGQIKGMDVDYSRVDGRTQIYLILKRDIYHYIRVIDRQGNIIDEFSLDEDDENTNYYDLRVFPEGNKRYIAVKKVKDNQASLVKIDINGVRQAEIPLPENNLWDLSKDGEIYFSYLKDGQLIVKKTDFSGLIQYSWETKADQILSFQSGPILHSKRYDQVIIIKQGDQVKQIVLDLAANIYFSLDLGKYNPADKWNILQGRFGNIMLPYQQTGGTFTAYKNGYRWAGRFTVPDLTEYDAITAVFGL